MPIRSDGPITTGTVENLIQGLRSKPMTPEAVGAALVQSVGFAEKLVAVYTAEVAAGEVGPTGSGTASEEPITGERAPTTLIYGRVQSGKTAAMILTSALCLENGFRLILVLTANNVALVDQTTNRFKALNGPRVFSSHKVDGYEWEGQEDDLREDIAEGLVLVCAKDSFHLPKIIEFLQQIEAPSYPALVLDDEADAATPDTTLAARTSGRANAPEHASTINRRVIENVMPGQEGESIGEILPHSLYVQVTATPFLFFLQRQNGRIRPTDTLLLEPGHGYCGGEIFFGDFDPDSANAPEPPLVLISTSERTRIHRRAIPEGLAASVEFFLLAAAAMVELGGRWPAEGFKHISHTSPNIADHAIVVRHIERHVTQLRRLIKQNPQAALEQLQSAYTELQRTLPHAPTLDVLIPQIAGALKQVEYRAINSAADAPSYGPRINFLVGGNILGRGLTIDDLLVTYYVREAQVSQMDTVWQHARMYGYREPLLPYTRVFLPPQVAARFKEIHQTEEILREFLKTAAAGGEVPIRIALGTRATRPNATEATELRAIAAGVAQINAAYAVEDRTTAQEIHRLLARAALF